MPRSELARLIFSGGWKNVRDEIIDEDLKKVKRSLESYGDALADICRDSVEIIRDNLKELRHRADKLNLGEIKLISSVVADIDKLARLEAGKPTSILHTSYSQEDVVKLILEIQEVDPFINYIDVTDSSPKAITGDNEKPLVLGGVQGETCSTGERVDSASDTSKDTQSDF